MYSAIIASPVGKLGIQVSDDVLEKIVFLSSKCSVRPAKDSFTKEVITQLNKYFKNPNFHFNLPTQLSVTPFQTRVLNALQKILPSKTQTYGELAKQLKTGARAIGGACRRNPLPIIIPCHRIVAKNHIGGFSGASQGEKMKIKQWLLGHEI